MWCTRAKKKEITECNRGEKGRFSLFSFVKCWSFARSHQQLAICHTFLVKQELHSSFLRCWLILQVLTPTQCTLISLGPKDPCSVFYQSGDLPRRTLATLYGRSSWKPFSFFSLRSAAFPKPVCTCWMGMGTHTWNSALCGIEKMGLSTEANSCCR